MALNRQQALEVLADAYDTEKADFNSGMNDGELSPTKAGEYLIDEHGVSDDDAYEWAFDWVTMMELPEDDKEDPRIVGYPGW